MEYFAWFLIVLYAAAGLTYLRAFRHKSIATFKAGRSLLAAVVILHCVFIVWQTIDAGRIPIATVSEALGTFVFVTSALYLGLELLLRNFAIGPFILPLLTIMMLIAGLFFEPGGEIAAILMNVEFEIHVLLLMFAYGAFALSFIASVLYLLLAREIREKSLGIFYSRLPSLPYFERIANWSASIGLVCFSAGVLVGIHIAFQVWKQFSLFDVKFLIVYLNWLLYLAHYLGRRFLHWRGKRVAWISVAGFLLVLFSFLGASQLFHGAHSFK